MSISQLTNFRPVKGYEQYYSVSDDGAVYSHISGKFLSQIENPQTGYFHLALCDPINKTKETKTIHRIVAEAWLENPNHYNCVNHKNENRRDNHADNLEWCTQQYNLTYHDKHKKCCKAVEQIDRASGKVIAIWESATEAARHLSTNNKNISSVCYGLRKSAGGYEWRFVNG